MSVTFDGTGIATIQSQAFIDRQKLRIISSPNFNDDQKAQQIYQMYASNGLKQGTYYRFDYDTNPAYGGYVPDQKEEHQEYSASSTNSMVKYAIFLFFVWLFFWGSEKIDDRLAKNHINFSIIKTFGNAGQALVNSTGMIRTEPRTK